jgi:hypothetical protein
MENETNVVPMAGNRTLYRECILGSAKSKEAAAQERTDRFGGLTSRPGTFSTISKALRQHIRDVGLTPTDYIIIESILDHEVGYPVPMSWIYEDTSLGDRTVQKHIAAMKAKNLVVETKKLVRGVETNAYDFTPLWAHLKAIVGECTNDRHKH